MKTFIPDQPVYIGFTGLAGTGKTSTANLIVPPISASIYNDSEHLPDLVWDHFWFSAPLYQLFDIRTKTEGEDATDRMLYSIHELFNSVMMRRISYDDMVELTYDLLSLPLKTSDHKPRAFLHAAGDLCRSLYPDCIVEYTKYKVYKTWQEISLDYDRHNEEPPWYLAIISDTRMLNEAQMIKTRVNNFLINFKASDEVRKQRLLDRDGTDLSSSEKQHSTETSIDTIPESWYDLVVDTTDMTQEDQVNEVHNFILNNIQVKVY